ncbi:hypothetical protein [Ruegeria sp.]|uniref:hypothetical protein n=1 Tax=Ruegeria sp. TaxID=1879320 RepID=UPI003B59E912
MVQRRGSGRSVPDPVSICRLGPVKFAIAGAAPCVGRMARTGIAKLFANGCKEQWMVRSGGHLKGIAIPKIVRIRSGVAV